ncbi:MAG: hypothetical protein C5B49_02535 [Bdellovibrio sp.]|nr:MAG: hypothetical protein C5B49_02535 [Bdellovibrio sp.]
MKSQMRSHMMSHIVPLVLIVFALPFLAFGAAKGRVIKAHAISIHGTPKYGPGFQHVDFADPAAPKGGTILLHAVGGFDSLNAMSLKGNPAPGLADTMDTLTQAIADDPETGYCLVCESIEYPSDRTYVIFHLNPKAKFQDGSPILAGDVAFSFDTITKNLPQYKAYYADVLSPVIVDAHTIRFNFKHQNNELPMILGEIPLLAKKFWSTHDITKTTLEVPLGSGPYKIKTFEAGRSITYELVQDYWAKDLPIRRGFNNFSTIRYDIYGDEDVALEAFKGGAYDWRLEMSSKNWQQGYESEGKRKGQMIQELIPDNSPQGYQGFDFNLRRPLFKSKEVREAIALLFDFEWMNKNLFFDAYTRSASYFENSPMAARGLPTGEELRILAKFKAQLPPELFPQPFTLPTNNTDEERQANLRKALKLFEQAGWKSSGGALKNAAGQPFQFEYLMTASPAFERVVLAFQQSLKKAGIQMSVRTVDGAQYINRLRDFDFDMISSRQGESDSPGNEQRDFWGSAAAKQKGSRNFPGIENPVIDEIIEGLVAAKTVPSLTAHVRALDRVLLWNHYSVLNWYLPKDRLAFWNKFGRPKKNAPRMPNFNTWWLDPAKDAALKKDRG